MNVPEPPHPDEGLVRDLTAVVRSVGLMCEDVTIRDRGGRRFVTVVVDLPEDRTGSADLDTVAEASRLVSEHLDAEEGFLAGAPYELEVTTPGAERALTAPRHFRRARGRLVSLRTHEGRELTARLLDVTDGDVLRLRPQDPPGGKPRAGRPRVRDVEELPLTDVSSATVLLEFSPPDPDDIPDTAPSATEEG